MSTVPNPSPDLTRHQLDELDALLQRMLNLPLAGAAPSVLPKPPEVPVAQVPLPGDWRADLRQPTRMPYAVVEPAEAHAPTRTLRGIDANPLPRLHVEPTEPEAPTPAEVAPDEMLVDLTPAPRFAEVAAPVADDAAPVPMVVWPLYAANAVIESGLSRFGPLGDWLATPSVKTAFGVAGIVGLVGSAAWVAVAGR